MKSRKQIIIFMSVLTFIVLFFLVYFEFVYMKSFVHESFIINLLFSLFGSSITVIFVCLIEYLTERRYALEEFLLIVYNLNKQYRSLTPITTENSSKELLYEYVKLGELNLDEFDTAYGKLDFLVGNFRFRKWLYNDVYKKIKDLQIELLQKTDHVKFYLAGESTNEKVLFIVIKEINKLFYRSEIKEIDGYCTRCVYNVIYDDICYAMEKIRKEIYGHKQNIKRKETIIESSMNKI